MTVAAFFRDARVQGALSGDKSSPAGGLVGEFLAQYRIEDCTPQQLLALSDLAVKSADLKLAREVLDRAVQTGQSLHLALYKRGRLALMEQMPAAAARDFHLGTEADATFPFNWMGEARALHIQGLKDAAVAAAERFMGFGVRPHAPAELVAIAELADYLFDAGQRRRCQKLYEFVLHHGAGRPRDMVRLSDVLMGFNNPAAARALLLEQDQRGRLDSWGKRALALASSQLGLHDAAIAVAEQALLADPSALPCRTAYIDVLARAADADLIQDALARHEAALGTDGALELRVRLELLSGRLPAAAALLAVTPVEPQSRIYHIYFEMAYAAMAGVEADLALELAERLGRVAPDDTYVKVLRIDALFRQKLYGEAGRVLDTMPPSDDDPPHVVLKRFEHASFIGDTALAEPLLVRLDAMDQANRQFTLPVFRYLAEQKRWNELVDRALAWLDRTFNYRQIGYVLFRAAKHTFRHAELIAAVEAVPAWQERPDLVKLRANLAFDLADDIPALDSLAQDPTIARDSLLHRRLDIRRAVLAAAAAPAGRNAVVLCSDRNYLCATFVTLLNVMQQATINGLDAYVVVDDGLEDISQRAAARFLAEGLNVTIVAASSIVPDSTRLSPVYGVFTSGHLLAAAAYYRIYAAKHLRKLGLHNRLVYFDSDIFMRGRIDQLFAAELHGAPLAARVEPMRPEVRRAIALHGLPNDRYFNSGVLVFDLRHEKLATALDGSLAAIVDDRTTLLFHDQCALNLGFRGGFADLDPVWNAAVQETTRLSEVPADAIVLHFPDRPKPWSAAYGGEAGVLWANHWRELGAFIGDSLALELLELSED